jgi:hypothetical protein
MGKGFAASLRSREGVGGQIKMNLFLKQYINKIEI